MSAVYGVIRKLGATSKYKGYYYVVDAVEMAQKIYERPVKVTKIFIRSLQENINQRRLM